MSAWGHKGTHARSKICRYSRLELLTPAPNWAIDIFPPNMQRARWERMGLAIGEREITQN